MSYQTSNPNKVQNTYDAEIASAVYLQGRVDHTPIGLRHHGSCTHRMVDGTAVLLQILAHALPALRHNVGRGDQIFLHVPRKRIGLVQLERELDCASGEVQVGVVREVLRVDRGRGKRVGRGDVHRPAGQRERLKAIERGVALARLGERNVWERLTAAEVQDSGIS